MSVKIDTDRLSAELQDSINSVRTDPPEEEEFYIGKTTDGLLIFAGVRQKDEYDDNPEILAPCVVEKPGEWPEFVDMSRDMQLMIDSRVNAFAVQLVAESFAALRDSGTPLEEPLRFKFRGVKFTIEDDPGTEVAKGGE